MPYVSGDLVPRGSLGVYESDALNHMQRGGFAGDELGKISLKKIGRTVKKAAKDTGRGVLKVAKDTGRGVLKVAKVAAPIAIPLAVGGVGAVAAKKGVGAILGRRRASAARKAAPVAAAAAAPSVLFRTVPTPSADATEVMGVASGRNRTRRDPRDTRTPVQRAAGNVMRTTRRTRAEVDERQQQTRDAARRARQVAEIAQGTPMAAAATRAAEVAEQIAERAQVVTNTVRSATAGVDGAIVGAGSAVAAEQAQQGVGAFFRSRQGLYVIGAGLAAAVLLSSRRK